MVPLACAGAGWFGSSVVTENRALPAWSGQVTRSGQVTLTFGTTRRLWRWRELLILEIRLHRLPRLRVTSAHDFPQRHALYATFGVHPDQIAVVATRVTPVLGRILIDHFWRDTGSGEVEALTPLYAITVSVRTAQPGLAQPFCSHRGQCTTSRDRHIRRRPPART